MEGHLECGKPHIPCKYFHDLDFLCLQNIPKNFKTMDMSGAQNWGGAVSWGTDI
jgi:hypothetical protein